MTAQGPAYPVLDDVIQPRDMLTAPAYVTIQAINAPCDGLPTSQDALEWYREGNTLSHALVHLKGDVLRARTCSGSTIDPSQVDLPHRMCLNCLRLWFHPKAASQGRIGKAQGSIKGSVYGAILNRNRRRVNGALPIIRHRADLRRERKADKAVLEKAVRDKSQMICQFSPELLKLIQKLQENLDKGYMSAAFIEQQTVDLNNRCRSGKSVHGRRYDTQEAATMVAAGLVMDMKQLSSTSAMLQANGLAAFPSKRTIRRMVNTVGKPCQGVQGARFLEHLSSIVGRPQARLHASNDEVALNQLIGYVNTEDGNEVVGVADRCVREKNPVGVQYLVTEEPSIEVRTTQLIDGRPVVSSELKPFSHLQVIATMKPATLMCLWILFGPVRNQSNIIVAAIPTRGDLTVTDDALLLHDIIKCAWQQGHPVCYYGADNASPHAALCRGIQRGLVLQEIKFISKWIPNRDANTESTRCPSAIVSQCTNEGEELSDATAGLEPESLAVALVPHLQRPVSVVQLMLEQLMHGEGTPKERQKRILSDQWVIPYPGLPYAAQRCCITGGFLGVSCEYRHDTRLMVCH